MKIAVLDDEKKAAELLTSYLKKYADEKSLSFDISVYNSAEKMLENYDCSFDMLFLDIEMSGINGIQAAKLIRAKDEGVVIVFITNMSQYALQGYEVNAVDYILKPVTYEKFLLKINKVLRRLPDDKNEMIMLRTTSGVLNIPILSIKYIEVNKNYLFYYTVTDTHKVRGTITEAAKNFVSSNFIRISNSYIVNLKYVTKITASSVYINNDELSISRGKKEEFMQQYLRFMEKVQ